MAGTEIVQIRGRPTMETTLVGMLDSIPRPNLGGVSRYYVQHIPGTLSHLFGWSSDGFPSLLLATEGSVVRAPLRLAGIEAYFSIQCEIALPDGQESAGTLTTIRCTSLDSADHTYFAHICESIVRIVGDKPDIRTVTDAVNHIVTLFQRLAKPSNRSVRGLFGELYLIHRSKSPFTAVEAWHSSVDERFDFSIGDIRLEVKSSSTRQRIHNFSLEQCKPPSGTVGILASLYVETSGGGLSLLELIHRIERQLDGTENLVLKLHNVIADALGAEVATSLSIRFDEELSESSIQMYELEAIPAVRDCVPDYVSRVHFQSDISHTARADAGYLAAQSRYANALLPSTA